MAEYIFGRLPKIKEGDTFKNRRELREKGIHLAIQAGIDGNPKVGSPSIVLSGGYEDDEDFGETIIYTGHGGNDPNSRKQVSDQSWDATGNKALLVSEIHGLPIRVTRGAKHKSEFSPKTGYKYAGLYRITNHFEETGINGFLVFRFKLEKIELEKTYTEPNTQTIILPQVNENPSERIETTIMRIVRNTKLSLRVKEKYDYTCQICGIKLSVHNIRYAEAAHIQPLGIPHAGQDSIDNILCLCPNHHVMLDKGMIAINDDFSLIGTEGEIKFHKSHKLNEKNIQYHREHIFINK